MTERNIWVISDTHFGHANIIKYCDRPFANTAEMDEMMFDNWNQTVKDGDIVYHLGDVYFGGNEYAEGWNKKFKKLPGRKRLILGNHDEGKDKYLQDAFQKISMWRMFPEFGLLLTHVPVHESNIGVRVAENEDEVGDQIRVLHNVHGHIHQNPSPNENYTNMSVEWINYTPVNLETLRKK